MPGNLHTTSLDDIARWPKPNYQNPVQRTWIPGFAIFWAVVSSALVGGRLYLRLRNRSGSYGLDDSFIFVAWAFSIAFTVAACVSVWDWDVGRHVWDVRPEKYEGALYMAWVAQVMFLFSTCATKLSVLCFYHRMVNNALYNKWWKYTVWMLMVITTGSWVAIFFAYCFMCRPLDTYWDFHKYLLQQSTFECLDGDALTIAVGVLTIASDFWTAALPCAMFQYHDLGVSKRQKVALNVIFCLGFLVTGVGIARTYYLWEIGQNEDLSWIGYDLFAASIVECQLAIVLTCAPFLRAFLRRYFPDVVVRNRTKYSNNTARSTVNTVGDRSSMGTARSTVRGSYLATPLEPLPARPMDFKDLESQEEKTGFLVKEEGSGRLVWSHKAQRMSSMLREEPVEYT